MDLHFLRTEGMGPAWFFLKFPWQSMGPMKFVASTDGNTVNRSA